MKYFCNPINFSYQYQFNQERDGTLHIDREAADPSMVLFKGLYYIFPSMTCGFLYSDDLTEWKFRPVKNLPVYDYAPDVRVVGEWLYFCASNHSYGHHYRTKDPFSDEYELLEGAFGFWDPNLFCDEDGRCYFYWGSSGSQPICGIELNPETMQPIGEKRLLFANGEEEKGFERRGEDHVPQRSQAEKEAMRRHLESIPNMSEQQRAMALDYISDRGYVEGAWMNKHNGRYYLQYGTPGAQFNIYADGVYVSENPLGPFVLANNNPFSYKPGGFLPGAGHGSTMEDSKGALWHTSTMRISVNHVFERRIGLWPAGYDADGELFCNQRYGDWPCSVEQFRQNIWANPPWMLLSYGKKAWASSEVEGKTADLAIDENVRTWWRAASANPGEWLVVDLEKISSLHAVQINFADDRINEYDYPAVTQRMKMALDNMTGDTGVRRWIDTNHGFTRWKLEVSLDGKSWQMLQDKRDVETDLPHDLVVCEEGVSARYLRLTVISLPYDQCACVSGLRVFGFAPGKKPAQVDRFSCRAAGELDLHLEWEGQATGYVVSWGHTPDKLYHSYMTFSPRVHLGGLVKGQKLWGRVDSFNESGITEGCVCPLS